MKAVCSLFLVLLFLTVSVAVGDGACASIAKGQPACCQDCPLRMTAKIGDSSCCRQGLEKGNVGFVLQQPVKKLVPVMTAALVKNKWVVFHLSSVSFALPKENSIYLAEEHLLL